MGSHLFLQPLLSTAEIVHLIVFTQGVFYGKTMFAEKPLIKPIFFFFFLLLFCWFHSFLWSIWLKYWCSKCTIIQAWDRQYQFLTEPEGLCLTMYDLTTLVFFSQFSQRCKSATMASAVSTSFTVNHLFTTICIVQYTSKWALFGNRQGWLWHHWKSVSVVYN